jgi:periplasmic protein TonB
MISKKSKSANLENKRSIFMQIGLIIALSLVLAAFNWKTYDKMVIPDFQRTVDNTPEDMVQITEQKPPEPKVERPRVNLAINIVDDESPVDDDFMINAEIDPLDTVPVYIPAPSVGDEESIQDEEIFTVVESMPSFPGGDAGVYAYLQKNTKFPKQAIEANITGTVYVAFVVEKDGSITDVRILRGIGGGCDEEALRVVKNMPRWTPGKQRNIPVRVNFNLGIKFTLYQM